MLTRTGGLLVQVSSPTSLLPVQQRLFTGGLFLADVNANLHRFAVQHRLRSNVWIPLKAFDVTLKPFGVFVLPSAALCDISLSPGGGFSVGSTLGTSAASRVLVNADHTSNPELFHRFQTLLVPPPSVLRGLGARLDSAPRNERDIAPCSSNGRRLDTCWRRGVPTDRASGNSHRPLSFGGFVDHPVNALGEPVVNADLAQSLAAHKQAAGYFSNYWIRVAAPHMGKDSGQHSFRNAEETEWPGRYNPTYTNGYVPVSLVGAGFRQDEVRLMRVRAARYGYVSRVWLTLSEAKELFGTRLRPSRADDTPCVVYGGGSMTPVLLYCADQFEDSDRLFPSARQIALARSGVWLPLEKLRGYPLLHKLCRETTGSAGALTEAAVVRTDTAIPGSTVLRDARVGADTAMHEVKRHLRLIEERAKLARLRLFGFRTREDERRHLRLCVGLEDNLREQAILKGFPTPHFVSSRHLHTYCLEARRDEVGVVQWPLPCHLWGEAWVDGEVWFNVAQLTEPVTALTLFYHHPVHLLTRCRLTNEVGTHCARLQLRRGYTSGEWVPRYVVRDAGWSVRAGAPAIPFPPTAFDLGYAHGKNEEATLLDHTLVNVEELDLPTMTKDFLQHYRPVDTQGRPYLRSLRMLLTLRALEQGYTSAVWVPVYPSSSYICQLRQEPDAETCGGPRLTGSAFTTTPHVHFRSVVFANAEEVANLDHLGGVQPPVALEDMTAYRRAREKRGEGVSAEQLNVPELRRQRRDWEQSAYGDDSCGDGSPTAFQSDDDVFGANYDLLMEDS